MDIKNRICYLTGEWGPWLVHREEHIIQSTAQKVFQDNPNISSITYTLENGTKIEYAPYKDPVMEAVEELLGPDGERMDAFAMLMGNLWPETEDPDHQLFLRICQRYLDPPTS